MKTILLLLAATLAPAYQVDTMELRPSPGNRFALEVDKTGLLRGKTHIFVFGKYSGAAEYNSQKPELSKVHFEIDAKSIVCEDTWVSDKDKVKIMKAAQEDMLAADKYPQITFVSNHVTAKGPGQFEVTGTLSIRGMVQPATVTVTRNADAYDGASVVNMKD